MRRAWLTLSVALVNSFLFRAKDLDGVGPPVPHGAASAKEASVGRDDGVRAQERPWAQGSLPRQTSTSGPAGGPRPQREPGLVPGTSPPSSSQEGARSPLPRWPLSRAVTPRLHRDVPPPARRPCWRVWGSGSGTEGVRGSVVPRHFLGRPLGGVPSGPVSCDLEGGVSRRPRG